MFEFGSAGREPGTYNVALTVAGDAFNPASAQTTITVREYRPPTGTAQANPAEIHAGDKSSLSASFQGQCGGAIQAPAFEASEGSVQGDQFDSTGVQFDPAVMRSSARPYHYRQGRRQPECRDRNHQHRSDQAGRDCADPSADVLFPANSSRVNNCGKHPVGTTACLFERDSTARSFLGHSSSDETAANRRSTVL